MYELYFPEATRERAFDLVAQAFSSINADDFAAYVGLPVNEAIQGICCLISHYENMPIQIY